jgi:hypothetical protein
MPSYEVRRSTTINRSCADILEYLSDFENWPAWSPWLILEPDCEVNYHGIQGQLGAGYSWNGEIIGAGSMTFTAKDADSLDMELHVLRPFKSRAHVRFDVIQGDDTCIVTWVMTSKLPWYLFFMKNIMKSWIRMDYDRGLLMLKSQLETGKVPSTPKIIGEQHQPQLHYIALKGRATIPELGSVMQEHFARLFAFTQAKNLIISAPRFTLYESMDISTTEFEFFTCLPIAKPLEVEPPLVCDGLEACDTFVIQHKGAYPFMGNAWSLAMMASRHQKIKVQRKPMGIERYLNSPDDVNNADLLTDIVLFKR